MNQDHAYQPRLIINITINHQENLEQHEAQNTNKHFNIQMIDDEKKQELDMLIHAGIFDLVLELV